MSDDTRERSNHAARDASAPPNGSDGNQTMLQSDGHLDVEMVSAWLDAPDDFSEQDRLAIETHLASCAQCTQVAAELTAIVRAFQTLPMAASPHSFALTPDTAGLVATPTLPAARRLEEPAFPHERSLGRPSRTQVPLYEPAPWYERQMHRLRWMTAVAALLFVFFVSVDVLGNIDSGGDDDDMAVDTEMTSEMAPAAGGAQAEMTATTGSSVSDMMPTAASDDSARNADATNTPASSSSGAEPTPATTGSTESTESGGEVPPASADTQATTTAGDEALTMMTPNETEQADTADQAQSQDGTSQAYGSAPNDDGGESDSLHLIELALAIAIAWLIVAMIALPRWRRM